MQYKINEVSKITGIPVDTLRYYEKIGVITPKINETNRYRYYTAWDINFIFDYNNYRKLEYSSKDALHFVHEATLDEQVDMLHQKSAFYDNQIDRYMRLQIRNEEIIRQISMVPESLNKVSLEQVSASRFICYRENYEFYGFKEYMKEIHAWLQKIELTENAIILPREMLLNRTENQYQWALLAREEDFEELSLPASDNTGRIEAGICVKIMVEAGGEGTFHYSLLDPAMEYIKRHRFKLCGDPYGVLMIRSHDESRIQRYFTFYLPICE